MLLFTLILGHPTCSVTCAMQSKKQSLMKSQDHIQEYSRALVFRGLCDMATQDMIREGDGDALNRDWRLYNIEFQEKHRNYFPIACTLFAGKDLVKSYLNHLDS